MPLRPNMEPQEYAAVLLRRKWFILFTVLIILFGASVYCVVTPERFKSATTILVIPQRVPEGYVQSTVTTRIEDRLSTIQQQVMSRTRLLTVMEELGLFREERRKRPLEEVIEEMRGRIEIHVRGGRFGDSPGEGFTLSFVHENRQMAMLTTARLASFFIDENLKTREQQAVGTSEFLESQLKETKRSLEAAEERVRRYKMQFMGELPQQMQANLQILSRLQDQLRSNADAIRTAEDRKVFLESQIQGLEIQARDKEKPVPFASGDGRDASLPDASGGDPLVPVLAELAAKQARLADLSARYTDRYPEVVRLRREVAQMKERIAEYRQNPPPEATPKEKPKGETRYVSRPATAEREEIRRIRAQVAALEMEIPSLKRERRDLMKSVGSMEGKVAQSPKREQEMIALTRDYDNLRATYDDLLKKKLQADISQNLEKRQKGEQFQVLDPANLPEHPFVPNRKKIFGVAVTASLLFAFGGAVAMEMLDRTLRTMREFRCFFDVPVLASIPVLRNRQYARRKALRRAAVLGGLLAFTGIVTVFLLAYSERIKTILNIT